MSFIEKIQSLYNKYTTIETPQAKLSDKDINQNSIQSYWKAIRMYQNGEVRYAIDEFKRSIEFDMRNCYAWFDMGIVYDDAKKDHQSAEQCYRKALEMEPTNSHFLNRLATCVGKQGRLYESIEISKKVLSIYPRNKVAKRNLGFARSQKSYT